jgi:N-methylhydantoinase A
MRESAVGIDVGGTFTDLAAIDRDGQVRTVKVLSVPTDRASGVIAAIEAAQLTGDELAYIAHGTTVVTNLLLERRGARVVACATAGFTDLLELRRQDRAALYDLTRHHAPPLVGREDIVGVNERLVPDGVLQALDDDQARSIAIRVLDLQPETIAICFLHAYADGRHESQLRDALHAEAAKRGVQCDVVCSHEVLPEIREYERMATTVAESYARPAVGLYLKSLTGRLAQRGMPSIRVMTSAGGTLQSSVAAQRAASLALSGPAGGVTGAAAVLRSLDIPVALTIDIGGTSADVGLIVDGEPLVERGGAVAGVPIALPRVLVEAVAAGGGSIGWIDAGGAIRAGPASAGASPGPACYGMGGTRATVTDAHVVLGNVAAGKWSGGVTIDAALARAAMAPLAESLGVSLERASQALIATADATMARALRRVSVERGINPRDVALVAFGGGGPLHACGLAEQLGIRRVVVPPHAGVLSAIGLAVAPERRERLASYIAFVRDLSVDSLSTVLRNEESMLHMEGDNTATETRWWLRARYEWQGHELDVPLAIGESGEALAERFVSLHERRTGFTLDRRVECISVRTAVVGAPWPVKFRRPARHSALNDNTVDDGAELDRTVHGEAIVRLPDATMMVAAGWTARALHIGGWMLEQT